MDGDLSSVGPHRSRSEGRRCSSAPPSPVTPTSSGASCWRRTTGTASSGSPPSSSPLSRTPRATSSAGPAGTTSGSSQRPAPSEPIGAAWARHLPESEPGYGFVAADVPELTLGLLPEHRGRGHGRALMEALIRAAAERPVPVARLSLSVEDGNPAVHLYTALGFTRVGRSGNSDTMVLDVQTCRTPLSGR
ncbi:GNAT family N-acetyltransferase [Kitasatospora arboriphila]